MSKNEIIENELKVILDASHKYCTGKHSTEAIREIVKISLNLIWEYAKLEK